MSLDEKHALITGSSRGIGRGIALARAEERVNITVNAIDAKRNFLRARLRTCEKIRTAPVRARAKDVC